ncbi:MAG: hypothetical protein J6T03_03785 [Bacteroidales bacterium]|nr:hypothetical protein [Bacteroidales bacterium]
MGLRYDCGVFASAIGGEEGVMCRRVEVAAANGGGFGARVVVVVEG